MVNSIPKLCKESRVGKKQEKNFLGIPVYPKNPEEAYMCQPQKDHFHLVLTTWFRSLLEETDEVVEHLQTEDVISDPLDRASHEEAQRLELRSSDRRRKLQSKIEEAIDRVNRGEYGFCRTCGSEIGIPRLEVRPTADECIKCKTVSEIKEKRDVG